MQTVEPGDHAGKPPDRSLAEDVALPDPPRSGFVLSLLMGRSRPGTVPEQYRISGLEPKRSLPSKSLTLNRAWRWP